MLKHVTNHDCRPTSFQSHHTLDLLGHQVLKQLLMIGYTLFNFLITVIVPESCDQIMEITFLKYVVVALWQRLYPNRHHSILTVLFKLPLVFETVSLNYLVILIYQLISFSGDSGKGRL